jgi:hypothetical protein
MENKTAPFTPLSFHDIPELEKAHKILSNLNSKVEVIKGKRKIKEEEKHEYANDVLTILQYVGELTDPLFADRDNIEAKHFALIKNPKTAREMFLNEYESKHKPYDQVKKYGWDVFYRIMGIKDIE